MTKGRTHSAKDSFGCFIHVVVILMELRKHQRWRFSRRHSHHRLTGTGSSVRKANFQEVIFTPADAAEALETIARLGKDGRGSIPARLMYNDPHKPPVWWHVRHMLNLTLLAHTATAQEGTAPAPGNPPQMSFVEDPVNNGTALLRLKDKLKQWNNGRIAPNRSRRPSSPLT